MEAPWRAKCHRLIAAMCLASYRQANTPTRKRHRPYSVPADAAFLVRCLETNDREAAAAHFLARAMYGTPDSQSLNL